MQEAFNAAHQERKAIFVAMTIGPSLSLVFMFGAYAKWPPRNRLDEIGLIGTCVMLAGLIVYAAIRPYLYTARTGYEAVNNIKKNLWDYAEAVALGLGLPPEDADLNKDGAIGGIPVGQYKVTDFRDKFTNAGGSPVVTTSDPEINLRVVQYHVKLGNPFPLDRAGHGKLTLGQVLDFWDQAVAPGGSFARDSFWVRSKMPSRFIGTNGAKEEKVTASLWARITESLIAVGLVWEDDKKVRHAKNYKRDAVVGILARYAYAEKQDEVIHL